eukprot:6201564-Pleurochrysis_carterae.AAC.3
MSLNAIRADAVKYRSSIPDFTGHVKLISYINELCEEGLELAEARICTIYVEKGQQQMTASR